MRNDLWIKIEFEFEFVFMNMFESQLHVTSLRGFLSRSVRVSVDSYSLLQVETSFHLVFWFNFPLPDSIRSEIDKLKARLHFDNLISSRRLREMSVYACSTLCQSQRGFQLFKIAQEFICAVSCTLFTLTQSDSKHSTHCMAADNLTLFSIYVG